MAKIRTIRWGLMILGMSIYSFAQNSAQPPAPAPDTAPAPAFGQNAPVLSPENPPVTGLDEPRLDLRSASRSFISPALQVAESASTNAQNQLGGSDLGSITSLLGAFDLQQFWPKSDLFVEYLGGGEFFSSPYDVRQLQAAGLEAVTRWRTGQATLRDAFSYLPDGSFEIGTFGGAPGFGLANGAGTGMQGGGLPGTHFFGSGLGGPSVGNTPRLSNTAILDAVQAVSPVAAITVAAGFSNAHFYDPTDFLINSDQLTIEGGYSHLLNRHDQLGLVYAFQLFQFPQATGGQIYINVVNVRWSHTITGRLSLLVGAGPQHIELEQGGYQSSWSLSARVQLRYKMGRASLVASYEKFTSAGSGLYFGADVQAARLGYTRPLGRTCEFYGDLGFSHNTKIQGQLSPSLGIAAGSYNNGSLAAILRKHIGRTYEFLVAYRFGDEAFSSSITVPGAGSGRTNQRQVGSIGVEWHPRPTRIE
ncbi:MAG: hypothetical protein WA718_20645 [Terriglobales bacterium]